MIVLIVKICCGLKSDTVVTGKCWQEHHGKLEVIRLHRKE